MAQLLSVQLKKQFLNIDIVKLISSIWVSREMNSLSDEETPDIIITSIPLPALKVPVVQVAPLMTCGDINKIQDKVENLIGDKNENKNRNYPLFKKYLNTKSLLINLSSDNFQEIITLLSKI